MPAAAVPIRDQVNAAMAPVWDIPPADRRLAQAWVCGWAADLTWQRWLHWKRELGLPDGLHSIEMGCGYGKFSMLLGLSGARTTLFDYNASTLAAATATHAQLGLQPATVHGDLLALSEELVGNYDLSCSFGTLEHFFGESRQEVFKATAAVLQPGGLMLVTVPNRAAIWYRVGFGARKHLGLLASGMKEKPFSRRELTRLALGAGLEVLELEATGTLGTDFRRWIGENVRSLSRKLTGRPTRAHGPAPEGPPAQIDLRAAIAPRPVPRRNYLNRRFTYNWMLVARKPQRPTAPDGKRP